MKFSNLEIYERVYSSHWFLTSYNGIGFVFDFPKIGGGKFITQVAYTMENEMCRYIFDRDEFEKTANFTAEKLINNNLWREKIYKKIQRYTKRYFAAGERLHKLQLSNLSDTLIIRLIRGIIPLQHYHQVYSVLANGVVLDGRNHLSNKIREELRSNLNFPLKFENYWSVLTQVTKMSLRQSKDYELAKLASLRTKLSLPLFEMRMKKLYERYCWLDYNNMGPAASIEEFRNQLNNSALNRKNLRIPNDLRSLKHKQQKLMKTLKFSSRSRFLVALAQNVIWQKGYRKDMQYHGFYCYENLFRELAKRKDLRNWQTLSFLFPWELEGYIRSNKPTVQELEQRRKFSVFIVTREGLQIMSGKNARNFAEKFGKLEAYSGIKELKGQPAFAGKVHGKVKIVQVRADIRKMQSGDILMSQATSPDLLPAMKIAGAIVTNTGGLICHAAITSRELKIPCIVGTAKATLVFKDGDLVEVDANKGIVRRLADK